MKAFNEYSANFNKYIQQQLENVKINDVIWDIFLPHNIKSSTRKKREVGKQRRVYPENSAPWNLQDFLHSEENKQEMFLFLARKHCWQYQAKRLMLNQTPRSCCMPLIQLEMAIAESWSEFRWCGIGHHVCITAQNWDLASIWKTWNKEQLSIYSCPWHCSLNWSKQVSLSPSIPCANWLWHNVWILWPH